MPASSWLIGSRSISAATVSVTANAVVENLSFPAGTYYAWDNGSAYDACTALCTMLISHSEIAGATPVLRQDGTLRITTTTACSFTMPADLQQLIPFSYSLAASANTASTSAFMWIPQRCAVWPISRLGTDKEMRDTVVTASGTSVVEATYNNSHYINRFEWRALLNDVVRSTSESNGEHYQFWRSVLAQMRRFKLWEGIIYDSGSTANVGLTGVHEMGPYKMRPSDDIFGYDYNRSTPNVEMLNEVALDVIRVANA